MGIEKVRKETVYAPGPVREALLKRLQKSKALSRDAWLERESPGIPRNSCKSNPWRCDV